MKFGARPDTPTEWLALKLNLALKPLADTQLSFQASRILIAASRVGLFEALRERARTAAEIAASCQTELTATAEVLNALLAHSYLEFRIGRYDLNRVSRKWILADSAYTTSHMLDFNEISCSAHAGQCPRSRLRLRAL